MEGGRKEGPRRRKKGFNPAAEGQNFALYLALPTDRSIDRQCESGQLAVASAPGDRAKEEDWRKGNKLLGGQQAGGRRAQGAAWRLTSLVGCSCRRTTLDGGQSSVEWRERGTQRRLNRTK